MAVNHHLDDSLTTQTDINLLMEHFVHNSYAPKGDIMGMLVLNTCLELFNKDYVYSVINNTDGRFCGHYPDKIVVLDYEMCGSAAVQNRYGLDTNQVWVKCGLDMDSLRISWNRYQYLHDNRQLEDFVRQSRVARCRARFVAPVILYKGKSFQCIVKWYDVYHTCRSAISFLPLMSLAALDGDTKMPGIFYGYQYVFDLYRGLDIKLLETLGVRYICDLMVELKKIKFGIHISSSEKVDRENRYKNFTIFALPYPGCELFAQWKENGYDSGHIYYDWSGTQNNSLLNLQDDRHLSSLPIDWYGYMTWDLVKLTQNYLQALLTLLEHGEGGLLVHCISGWDRTPLFVSLLRLSLWADGVIHKSLHTSDMLYLTIAYDWYLFGHALPDRLSKGEEIMYFCFKMLPHIVSTEFSVNPKCGHDVNGHNGVTTARAFRLMSVAKMFEEAYLNATLHRTVVTSRGMSSLIGNICRKIGLW